MSTSVSSGRTRSSVLGFFSGNLSIGVARNGMGAGQVLLATGMIGLGLRGLIYADFAGVWQHVTVVHAPWRSFLVYACAVIELATGAGLLARSTGKISAGVLSAYLVLWAMLLKFPAIISAPQTEVTWLGFGEIAVILAGAWVVFATLGSSSISRSAFMDGRSGMRNARLLFVASLPMIGLSHFVYADATVGFIPAWIPWHYGWAYLTGAANIFAALCILLAVWPRLAATLEAAMLSIITVLVWMPAVITSPGETSWTPFLMSSAIACGAWAVADSYRDVSWLAAGTLRLKQSSMSRYTEA